VPPANRDLCRGVWERRMGSLLTGKTVGIIGCGHIGKDLTLLLRPFECRILVHDIRDYRDFYESHGIETAPLEELLERSDVVTLHTPIDETTRNIISAARLALMKPGAVLINTARGGLVDEAALKDALREGRLWGAAFDAFAIEPHIDPELYNLPNFWATPHMGGNAEEAVLAMGRSAIAGLDDHRPPGPDWLDAWPN
jgi:D-3-phosphoglycerate dehydrogenase